MEEYAKILDELRKLPEDDYWTVLKDIKDEDTILAILKNTTSRYYDYNLRLIILMSENTYDLKKFLKDKDIEYCSYFLSDLYISGKGKRIRNDKEFFEICKEMIKKDIGKCSDILSARIFDNLFVENKQLLITTFYKLLEINKLECIGRLIPSNVPQNIIIESLKKYENDQLKVNNILNLYFCEYDEKNDNRSSLSLLLKNLNLNAIINYLYVYLNNKFVYNPKSGIYDSQLEKEYKLLYIEKIAKVTDDITLKKAIDTIILGDRVYLKEKLYDVLNDKDIKRYNSLSETSFYRMFIEKNIKIKDEKIGLIVEDIIKKIGNIEEDQEYKKIVDIIVSCDKINLKEKLYDVLNEEDINRYIELHNNIFPKDFEKLLEESEIGRIIKFKSLMNSNKLNEASSLLFKINDLSMIDDISIEKIIDLKLQNEKMYFYELREIFEKCLKSRKFDLANYI